MMARLEEMNSSLHRSIRGKSWPGNGPADTRLSTIADNLTRAADLVRAAEPNRPNRHATRADLAAAKTRLIPVSYTHLDVYKRQDHAAGCEHEPLTISVQR